MKRYDYDALEKMSKEDLKQAVKALQTSNKHLAKNLKAEKLKLNKFKEKAQNFDTLKNLLNS